MQFLVVTFFCLTSIISGSILFDSKLNNFWNQFKKENLKFYKNLDEEFQRYVEFFFFFKFSFYFNKLKIESSKTDVLFGSQI